jgi:predicted secreted protein
MTGEPFQDCPPDKPHVTGYDEAHLSDYLRLLDAEADGADWREAVSIIFDIDVAREPERARLIHRSHLARARWMTEIGYAYLLAPRVN